MDFAVPFSARKNCEQNISRDGLAVRIVGLTLMVIFATLPVLAQSPSYPDFTSITGLSLNGNAAQFNGKVLRLTPATPSQVGSAWFTTLQPVSEGFSTTFTFQITNTSQPSADGFAFVIQNSTAGTTALGTGGGYLGYTGIDHSLAIEFDTYANPWDPEYPGSADAPPVAANHVAIQSCGTAANTSVHPTCELGLATPPVQMNDGHLHTVQIEYTRAPIVAAAAACNPCSSSYLQVTIDGNALFEGNGVAVDLTQIGLSSPSEGAPPDSAFVGFTGATGASYENNDILSWTFTSHGGQTITQNNLPPNVFTTYNFGSYLYKIRPNQTIPTLSVTAVPTPAGTNGGPNFQSAECIVYDHTGGQCIEFHADCSPMNNAACTNVSYDVVTSYDVPGTVINGAGFLKASGLPCTNNTIFDSNIITFFSQSRIDPTTKGSSKPSFSCFVAVQNVDYSQSPADVDIANVASPKVVTGSNLTYLIPVVNFGPNAAQGVNITDTLPGETTYVSSGLCSLTGGCSALECSPSAGAVSCTVGSMDPFSVQVMVVVVHVTARAGTVLKNTAMSTAFNPDPRPADNVATATTLVVNKKY